MYHVSIYILKYQFQLRMGHKRSNWSS